MMRLFGLMRVLIVFVIDYFVICQLSGTRNVAIIVVAMVALYAWLGGYLTLFKENGVRFDKLPVCDGRRLSAARDQLAKEVRNVSSTDISKLKIYLIPSDDLQATAYGTNLVSVTRGMLNKTDAMTLNSVLAHEIAHALNLDPEFNRAVFANVVLVCGAISMVSYAVLVVVFLVFLVLRFFRSWLGYIAFKGTVKIIKGLFSFTQRAIIFTYRVIASLLSRREEYRCDLYSAKLDRSYGLLLANFLSHQEQCECSRQFTITQALYQTHPPTPKRVARLESYVGGNGI